MIQTCTSSTAGDMLTTGIQPLKDLLGTTSTSEDDNYTLALQAASRHVESFLGVTVSLGTYRETLSGNDDLELMLQQTPIRAVLGVFDATSTDDAVEILSSEYVREDDEVGLLSHPNGWGWTPAIRVNLERSPYRTDAKPWLVEYTAGYRIVESTTTDGGLTSTGRDVPEDVTLAVLFQAKSLFLAKNRQGGLKSLTVGPTQRVWTDPKDRTSILFPDAERLIAHRRRVAVV